MSDDEPKSAFELAMEKLREKDRQSGEKAPTALSTKQKEAIAACRSKAEAQLAEMEILFRSTRAAAAADPEELRKAEEEYTRDRRRVEQRRDGEIARIRAGKKSGD
jgi:hypothetical protein